MHPPDDFNPPIGIAETLAPGLRRIVAPNPSPMTYRGTNTYLLGSRQIAVIDPGPDDAAHLQAILQSTADARITDIIVTHSHLDHSPLARALSQATGAPVHGFGGPDAGRSAVMQDLARGGFDSGGEGIDHGFVPDRLMADGAVIAGDDWQLKVLHTPGHLGNHIALQWGAACFTGDHVMGWASSLVSPPDGDLTDFMASCARLQRQTWRVFYPGHGAPIADPAARLAWLIDHRKAREAAILSALSDAPATAGQLAKRIYIDTPHALLPAATRNVLAHLIDLAGKSLVISDGPIHAEAIFRRG